MLKQNIVTRGGDAPGTRRRDAYATGLGVIVAGLLLTVSSLHAEWPDPIANDVIPAHSTPLTHGPILGAIEEDAVNVWVRTATPTDFEIVYSRHRDLSQAKGSIKGRTDADKDNTGVVTLKGLKSDSRYYYGVRFGDDIVDNRVEFDRDWPSFKTLPDGTSAKDPYSNPKGLFNFTFSVGACQRQKSPKNNYGIYDNPPSFLNLWKNHGEDLSFHIINGDYTYEEQLDGTKAGYENNYKLYLKRGRNVSNLLRYVPMTTMYDDHEVNSNLDGAGEVGLRDGDHLVRDAGLDVWSYYAEWANYDSPHRGKIRFGKASVKGGSNVLHDPNADFSTLDPDKVTTVHIGNYIKKDGRSKAERGGDNNGVYGLLKVVDKHTIRITPKLRADGDVSYSIGTPHYFDKKIGNTHFFYLDMRAERSKWKGATHSHDEDRFILGDTQRKWLLDGAKNTDADFIFIVSPDPWVIYHTAFHGYPEKTQSKGDGFAGYVAEREKMIPVLDAIEKPVIIFTGDVHHPFAAQLTDNVWEFLCSPMNSAGHPLGTAGLPPMGGWFDSEGRKVKIKWAGGMPDNVHYLRQRQTFYTVVNVNNVVAVPKPKGAGLQHIAYDEPQVIVQFYDGYTGKLLYAEGISTLDSKSEQKLAPKKSRFPRDVLPDRGFN